MTRVGQIGVGRWGVNLLRTFDARSQVVTCVHRGSTATREWLAAHYPNVRVSVDPRDIFDAPDIDAVAIATPIDTHYLLAREALLAGKHVFVEKPMTPSATQAAELVELAERVQRTLLVGHVFLYHPVMTHLQAILRDDPPEYVSTTWNKMGSFGEGIEWNLVSHDLSIMLAMFGDDPELVTQTRARGLVTDKDEISLELAFSGGRGGSIAINRCSAATAKNVTVQTRSGAIYTWSGDALRSHQRDGIFDVAFESGAEPLGLEIDAFLAGVDGPPEIPPATRVAVRVVDIIETLLTGLAGSR